MNHNSSSYSKYRRDNTATFVAYRRLESYTDICSLLACLKYLSILVACLGLIFEVFEYYHWVVFDRTPLAHSLLIASGLFLAAVVFHFLRNKYLLKREQANAEYERLLGFQPGELWACPPTRRQH